MVRNNGGGQQSNVDNRDQASDKQNDVAIRLNEERFAHVMSCLVGKDVKVNMLNGRVMTGVFHSFDTIGRTNKPICVALKNASYVPTEENEMQEESSCLVYGGDYLSISAKDLNLGDWWRRESSTVPSPDDNDITPSVEAAEMENKQSFSAFKTDAEIAASKAGRKDMQLTQWIPEEPIEASQLYELDTGMKRTAWDQFESNRKNFGVKSTYDEKLYTTELNLDEVPDHLKEKANKLAAEIMVNNGDRCYSKLENYLELDEDNMVNPAAEALVKKALAEDIKDNIKEKVSASESRSKDPSLASEVTPAPAGKLLSSVNRGMSYKDIIANSTQMASQTQKETAAKSRRYDHGSEYPKPGTPRTEYYTKDAHIDRQKSNVVSGSSFKEEEKKNPFKDVDRKEIKTEDNKKVDIDSSFNTAKKILEKSGKKCTSDEMKLDSPTSTTPLSSKKAFTFNPNASSFTPISAMVAGPSMVTPFIPTTTTGISAMAGPKISTNGMTPMNLDASIATQMTNFENLEFKAFSTMNEFPALDISAYISSNWAMQDQQCNEMWPNCSEASYRSIIGDLGMYYAGHGMMAMRAPHPIMAAPGVPGFFIPPGAPIGYPAYHMGAVPMKMMHYARQVTPRYYSAPKFRYPYANAHNSYRGSGAETQQEQVSSLEHIPGVPEQHIYKEGNENMAQ